VDEKFDFEIHEATECDLRSHCLLLQGDKLQELKKQRPSVNYQTNQEIDVKDRSKEAKNVKHYDSQSITSGLFRYLSESQELKCLFYAELRTLHINENNKLNLTGIYCLK